LKSPTQSPAESLAPYERLEFPSLFEVARRPDEIPWEPFFEGVDIYRLHGDGLSGPSASLIRFRENATIPRHFHGGYEHIFVLAGRQRDQNGSISAGTLAVNPPGTEHVVHGEAGCIVLAIYQDAVIFR
jgi:anti-sigma factor ChrR (cupin superfamily)